MVKYVIATDFSSDSTQAYQYALMNTAHDVDELVFLHVIAEQPTEESRAALEQEARVVRSKYPVSDSVERARAKTCVLYKAAR